LIALLVGILEAAAGAAWAAHGFFSYPGRHIFFFVEWLFTWRGLVGAYLFFEGAARVAGAVAGEPIGCDWDALTTIEIEGALHRVARRDGDTFVLTPIPEGWIVRRRVRVPKI
jgi:hypothetical protein